MEKNNIENVAQADQEKVKLAISRWNKFLFSKESDKNLFEYFLEGTKKSQTIAQYSTIFLEQCIVWSLNKLETTPMHHNMRLKQSFQFLLDNTIEFNSTNELLSKLSEKISVMKKRNTYTADKHSRYFKYLTLGSYIDNKENKNNELFKFILEKVLEKSKIETILNHYNIIDETVAEETGVIFSNALMQKIENNASIIDDIILYAYDIENNNKKITFLDNIILSAKCHNMEIIKECWDIYTDKEKQSVVEKSLILDIPNTTLETLTGYKKYVKNILDSEVDIKDISNIKKSIKNKKKIELYFSLLEEIYNESETEEKRSNIQDYARMLYISIIEQSRPDLTKGLISIKAEKSIIQTEDVPLFVYHVLLHFPKLMGYHLVNELLESVKKVGKIKEFSDVFNTSQLFEVGIYRFQFNEEMKSEIKYIYHEFLKDKFTEENKGKVNKPIKRLKI